jgi:SAM-dependent methyltransferase
VSTPKIYDRIGIEYASQRKPDPHWVARIHRCLEGQHSLVNIGAGTGSYEPAFMPVVGVEPSLIMINQRSPSAAPAVCAVAEQMPFKDKAFDVALAVFTVHHWNDPAAGLSEMRRVSRKQVVVTWDPRIFASQFWFVRDYLPEAAERETRLGLATIETVRAHLGSSIIEPLPVPADCTDGFFGAYWRRPYAYFDSIVRSAISGLSLLNGDVVSRALEYLRTDLENGQWLERYSELTGLEEIDLGYRLVVAG